MGAGMNEKQKERQHYCLEHLRTTTARGVSLTEYAREAQFDNDAPYRSRALLIPSGLRIAVRGAYYSYYVTKCASGLAARSRGNGRGAGRWRGPISSEALGWSLGLDAAVFRLPRDV